MDYLFENIPEFHAEAASRQRTVELRQHAGVGQVFDFTGDEQSAVEEAVLETEIDGRTARDAPLVARHLEIVQILFDKGAIGKDAGILPASAKEVFFMKLQSGIG